MERFAVIVAVCLLFGFLGSGNTQENLPSSDDLIRKASEIANMHDINVNNSAGPVIEQTSNFLEQKCTKNGGPNAFNNSKRALTEMQQCFSSLINATQLNTEIERAKPRGELDEVFKKYCRRSPIFMTCVQNYITAIEPCLEEKERENEKIILNVTESLLNFVCYKEGDRIALFIAAGGPDCFQAKQQEIQHCVENTFNIHANITDPTVGIVPSFDSLPALIFGDKECADMDNLQRCIVEELEKCPDPTPGNIMESIFRFIKKVTPCETLLMNVRSAAITKELDSSSTIAKPMSIIVGLSFLLQYMYHKVLAA